jgi:subtilisin-like proprotein convertase family protein
MLERLLLVLCALSLVLASAPATQPMEAKRSKARRTMSRTFTEPDSLTMGAGNFQDRMFPYPSTIEVFGFKKATIRDVDVVLRQYQHDAPDDLDLLLVAPNGRTAIVMSDVGGDNATTEDLTFTLDDAAAATLPDSDPLASGAYRPANVGLGDTFLAPAPPPSGASALSVFNGGDPNGRWQLFVVDDDSGNIGTIFGGWELVITAKTKPQRHKR